MRHDDPTVRAAAFELATICEPSPDALLGRMMDVLHRVGESENALFYRAVETVADPRVATSVFRGGERASRAVAHVFRSLDSLRPREERHSAWNPGRVRRLETEAFLEGDATHDRAAWEGSRMYEAAIRPGGMDDQQRLLVRDGSFLVGWVGFLRNLRTPRFTAHDRRRLMPLVAPVTATVVAATRAQTGRTPDVPGDFVVKPDGRIDFASHEARRWLEIPGFPEALAAHVGEADREQRSTPAHAILREAEARTLRLDGAGVRYLVSVRPTRSMRLPLSFALSCAENEIAQLASTGASAAEIATLRGTAIGTVRNQLKRIYATLGVSNRLELARALEA